MSWPWAKRHPMPEPAEFIRQSTSVSIPDIASDTPSPAQGSYPRLPSEFVLPGAGTESFKKMWQGFPLIHVGEELPHISGCTNVRTA